MPASMIHISNLNFLKVIFVALGLPLVRAEFDNENYNYSVEMNFHHKAKCYRTSFKLQCTGGIESVWLQNPDYDIIEITIVAWPDEHFSPALIARYFPRIQTLNIYDSSFTKFSDDFPEMSHLKSVNLNGLGNITTVQKTLLSRLNALEKLDLRGNRLKTIHPDFISSPLKLRQVFLKDNKWNCNNPHFQWLAYLNSTSEMIARSRISDYANLTCEGNMYPKKPVYATMHYLKLLREECPDGCKCLLTNIVWKVKSKTEQDLIPIATVDCQSKGLVEMPPNIPNITTILLLQNNKITKINPLAQNMAYKNVAEVRLDYNNITTVAPLEGAYWLNSFRLLSLAGNNISHLPTYAFQSAFERNDDLLFLYLGNNPWHCSCSFIPRFQEFLKKYKNVIRDVNNIRCQNDETDISNIQIITLTRSVICKPDGQFYIVDVVNIILASLIIFVICKFGYDYYNFKKFGKLPWIASKIP